MGTLTLSNGTLNLGEGTFLNFDLGSSADLLSINPYATGYFSQSGTA